MSDELHVHPLRDLIEHGMTDDCPCGPESHPVKRGDGSIGWLVVHNSLDGREKREREDAATETADPCICPRFSDTGGVRIADLCCPVHGPGGTDPGDGRWDDAGSGGAG